MPHTLELLFLLEVICAWYNVTPTLHRPYTRHLFLILHEQSPLVSRLVVLGNFVLTLDGQLKNTLKLNLLKIFLYLCPSVKCLTTNLRKILPTHILMFSEDVGADYRVLMWRFLFIATGFWHI